MHPLVAARSAGAVRAAVRFRRTVWWTVGLGALLPVLLLFLAAPPIGLDPPPSTSTTIRPAAGGGGPDGVPAVAWQAVVRASIGAPARAGCEVPVAMLGAVMWVESGFGTHAGSSADADGNVWPPIFGPELAPGSGFAVIENDAYGRSLGVTTAYAKAVGPTQFLPSTWALYGQDGNGDGRADPQNLFDAAASTAAYLCAHGFAVDPDGAVLAYNPSWAYLAEVLVKAGQLQATAPVAVAAGGLATVGGITVAAELAGPMAALLDAAARDGIEFGGYGWRDTATQVALRQAHCGTSSWAIWEMPADQCSPPTAIPGRSMHEQGLAVDFYADGVTLREGSTGYRWLQANAAGYGLINLASEPWHWSTTGG